MLSIPSTVSIFLHTQPTDMRKGRDGLSGIVRQQFRADPLDGSIFLFINRPRDRIKILHWDGTGFPAPGQAGHLGVRRPLAGHSSLVSTSAYLHIAVDDPGDLGHLFRFEPLA